MIKKDILIVGVGMAGNRIAAMLHDRGYHTYYINTADQDLSEAKSITDAIYKVPNSMGCNKNRNRAIKYTRDYYNDIVEDIENRFSTQRYIYYIFSMGGGTGSGVSPFLIDIHGAMMPNKAISAVAIWPSKAEKVKAKENARDCYNTIAGSDFLKNVFWIDNNTSPLLETINHIFVEQFDDMVSVTSQEGNLDLADMDMLLKTPGSIQVRYILDEDTEAAISANFIHKKKSILSYSIGPELQRGCRHMIYSLTRDTDYRLIEKLLGNPETDFNMANDDDKDMVVAFGCHYPDNRYKEIKEEIKEEKKDIDFFIKEEVEEEEALQAAPEEEEEKPKLADILKKYR